MLPDHVGREGPPENMTKEEEITFYKLVDDVKSYREEFFTKLSKDTPTEEKVMYLVKKNVPSFIGLDMKNYEFKENDVVHIPDQLSELLLKEGFVEKVKK